MSAPIFCLKVQATKIILSQVHLAEVKHITKIATQCADTISLGAAICVSSYYVKVKNDAATDYTDVCGADSCPQLYTGNVDASDVDAVVTNEFDSPVGARFVRLNPQSWIVHIGLRWEVYGCDSLV